MKNMAHNFFRKLVIFFSLVVMCFFSISCGLDVYYILYPPSNAKVVDENTEALNRFFSFRTNDIENTSMSIYTGTSVIYKIYNTLPKLISESSSISNYNDEFSEKGYNRAIALGYQQLAISNNDFPLIAKDSSDRSVEIRLFTEGFVSDPYEAGIKVSGQYIMDGYDIAIPLRENETTFSFYSSEKDTIVNGHIYDNVIPNQEDIDVSYVSLSDPEQENVWYVNAFAVSVGMTSDFAYKYSELEPLGYIVIKESDFNK